MSPSGRNEPLANVGSRPIAVIQPDGARRRAQPAAAFGADSDFVQLVKLYGQLGTHEDARRYSPAECTGIRKQVITGNPNMRKVSTSCVERSNLTMRMHMRRFTKLTNGWSKKLKDHMHAISLHFMFYNFCKQHMTLRVSPAMAAGIADHLWSMEEIVMMTDTRDVTANRPK